MDEIYQKHADRYDELVDAEDYLGNLPRFLLSLVKWQGARVLEAGTGTGRVTRFYAEHAAEIYCCDRSEHMLSRAVSNLSPFLPKIQFLTADNLTLPHFRKPLDIFIEGWSFGHVILEQDEVPSTTRKLLANIERNLLPGGMMIIIETLGTAVPTPEVPHPLLSKFYEELQHVHSFRSQILRTDYQFDSPSRAADVLGFFFGEEMRDIVLKMDSHIIPEWTGIWYRSRHRMTSRL